VPVRASRAYTLSEARYTIPCSTTGEENTKPPVTYLHFILKLSDGFTGQHIFVRVQAVAVRVKGKLAPIGLNQESLSSAFIVVPLNCSTQCRRWRTDGANLRNGLVSTVVANAVALVAVPLLILWPGETQQSTINQ